MSAQTYTTTPPERATLDASCGSMVIEFGTGWCGWCRAAGPLLADAFARHPDVKRLQVEDGPGRPLGRSYRVKLWPTLIFLKNGEEVARVVRPGDQAELDDAFARLSAGTP